MLRVSTLICFLFFNSFTFNAQQKNVLFLGNSYTYYNLLPQLVDDIALSFGDTIYWDYNTPGGYTFQGHSTNATSLAKIALGFWDFVLLQEQSQLPSFPPTQVATDCFPYAEILVDSIRSSNPCAEPVFFMTWGRENGDPTNCANYPPVCTYDGMQARLRESYIQMSVDNNCTVSPVGAAWKYVRDNHPSIGLYSPDGSHPSIYGSYLAACVHYTTIFRKSTVGSTFMSSIGHGDAVTLQQAAEFVVLDSLTNWRIGANDALSDFTYQINGSQVDFTFTGQQADSVSWDFGDGYTSNINSPLHTYQGDNNYNVTAIAYNNCDSDTISQTIIISTLSSLKETIKFSIIQHHNNLELSFSNGELRIITLVDVTGKLLYHETTHQTNVSINFPKNIICFLTIAEKKGAKTIKLISQ